MMDEDMAIWGLMTRGDESGHRNNGDPFASPKRATKTIRQEGPTRRFGLLKGDKSAENRNGACKHDAKANGHSMDRLANVAL